ncbi:hypothetical protein CLV31_102364 [Algoriphagus aquaeductus]|uniref:Uncharacterized protein n=1 Tax=Algoriphagus aquaeductus TaxID=475299 RepID=A0A326RYC0_9BACT|nr:hypothetical protein [Algoriphagus aquaeductus]PZV86464.1 hypothetical protein CLV31_102364 [Algoriphagus aquaeductus]
MNELVFYSLLLVAILGHLVAAAKMYKEVQADESLTFKEKNDWKLKSLVSPAWYWYYYRQEKKRRNS